MIRLYQITHLLFADDTRLYQITHLLFADDTLVFCKASQDQMAYLSWLLIWFEAIFGLRINLEKSEILPMGRVENLELLALKLGCKVGVLPLGAPQICGGLGWGRGEVSEEINHVKEAIYF